VAVVNGGRLTTRQVWVLQAVARGQIEHDPLHGDLAACTLNGASVNWTLTGLAFRGLIAFDPWTPGPPRLTSPGADALGRAPGGGSLRIRCATDLLAGMPRRRG